MTDVKGIFKNTFHLYRIYQEEYLFHTILKNIVDTSPGAVQGIMTDTYNFYLRWKDAKETDAGQIYQESKEINQKYDNCDLCRGILVELCTILNQGLGKEYE